MKHVFIVNPNAGKANAAVAVVPSLIERLAPLGIDYAIEMTEHPGHATEIARRWAMTRDPIRFYACGGDGTLNEVLAGAYQYPQAEVACLPLGSGNDMIRNFGEKADFSDVLSLIEGTAIPIDLMEVNGKIGAAICSVGLDAAVANDMPRFRRMPLVNGSMAYGMAIVQNLCKRMGHVMSVTVDDETLVGEYMLAAVANGSYYGGGVCAAPSARVDDGLMDVVLVKKISRFKIAGVIGQYMKGEHLHGDEVAENLADVLTFRRGAEIVFQPEHPVIANVDGECSRETRIEVRCLPKSARFVLPVALYQAHEAELAGAAQPALV